MGAVTPGYRFSIIPEWVIVHPDVSPLAVRLFACLDRHGRDPLSCYPSHARLAEMAHCKERSVAEPLKQLERVGAVAIVPRWQHGRRTSNGYQLAGDAPFVYRAVERGYSSLQSRSSARDNRAQERDEREPPNEISKQGCSDTHDAPAPDAEEVARRAEGIAAREAARRQSTPEGSSVP